ncbi:hypothetical protein BM221_003012 [Beauveria bassiana]|uniref:Uncharacterized protein n=1 Tax=Beauveria bassiana TaxID=176275 RepID=A0A2N6NTG7_BEABA|nr:hypothetical protein BM221_003012 [Beauveria bassiana]
MGTERDKNARSAPVCVAPCKSVLCVSSVSKYRTEEKVDNSIKKFQRIRFDAIGDEVIRGGAQSAMSSSCRNVANNKQQEVQLQVVGFVELKQ